MPTYEYRCENGHEFEAFQKMSDEPLDTCPECGATARRKISSGAGLVFKGSGFYITDYKKPDEKKARKAKRGPKSDGGGSSDSSSASASADGGSSTPSKKAKKADGASD